MHREKSQEQSMEDQACASWEQIYSKSTTKYLCVSSTHRVSVGRVERVKSSMKHPELPGCICSVHGL